MNLLKNYLMPTLAKKIYIEIRFAVSLAANYYYDFKRYFRFSATADPYRTKLRHQGRIIAHYHVIEKGLSLKNPKTGFGVDIINNLLLILKDYQEKYGLDEVGQVALNVLFSYHQFNLDKALDNQGLYKQLIEIEEKAKSKEICNIKDGGVVKVSKEDIKKAANINFRDFVNARYSVRNFDVSEVSLELIKEAISIAIKTPSVCNRQTWKVYVFSEDNIKRKVLSHQNGNRGFGDTASKILIITSDLNYFLGASERNQCFIDGGLFSMSLIYALHSLGIGTCCLNWSVTYQTDQALRCEAGIGDSETIIMMLAVGHLPEQFSVARSSRRKVEEILIIK
ncbi:nitroreductase family protein [Microcystis aeruginosa CS-555/01A07]|uniref:nitroreductase family protein n=1 Tax=Microcystis aeruginosa TaxID=1126 RepID=UPI002330B2A8|nr:nitroreductase family protein [Microcystis aeruginosa]MDB9430536.1 nitroreductase family protein [Microcystis aeruginosa CS-555/01A07]